MPANKTNKFEKEVEDQIQKYIEYKIKLNSGRKIKYNSQTYISTFIPEIA